MKASLALALVLGTVAAAEPPVAKPPRGVFTGDQWRYRRATLFPDLATHILADVVAIPSGVGSWQAPEWALFGGVVGSTIVLSAGRPSLDVQFQEVLQHQLLGVGHFTIWNTAGDVAIWTTVGVATVGLLVYGLASGHDAATETSALLIEAFAVAQLYHQMIKLIVGRAGPNRPELEGQYLGPAQSLKLWPSGTPSGHMASMYAMLSVLMYTFDHPLLWVGLNAFALLFGASLVGDNYHWLSDVVLGAGLGFAVGRWVAQHRSTRFRDGPDGPERVGPVRFNVAPVLVPGSGAGLSLVMQF